MTNSKECKICLRVFSKPLKYSYRQWNTKIFCSNTCSAKFKTTKLIRKCLFCSKEFYTLPCLLKKGKGKFCSKACSAKTNKPAKGHKVTEEHKNIIRKMRTNKKHSKDTKEKMSKALIAHYDKIGRKIYKRYIHLTSSKQYRTWRESVFSRDSWTCQGCKLKGCYLEAHHIKSWARYPLLRYDIENGLTLCKECHKLTDNYKNKKCVL